jgi:hypothetical protein
MSVCSFKDENADVKTQQELTVRSFFAEVGASCVHQWTEIAAIFPEPVGVMALMLERVSQQRLRNFFDETQRLGTASLSPAGRLRLQAACFSHAAALTETLWQQLTPSVANALQLHSLFQNLLGPERDLCVAKFRWAIRRTHLPDRYIERELRWLQEHYREVIESQCEIVKREESGFLRGLVGGETAPTSMLRTMSLEVALDMIHANESALLVRSAGACVPCSLTPVAEVGGLVAGRRCTAQRVSHLLYVASLCG